MARNARTRVKRAATGHTPREAGHADARSARLQRCPQCKSTSLAEGLQGSWPGAGLTVVCGKCGWQGMYNAGMWG